MAARRWIQQATANSSGQLRRSLKARKGEPIPAGRLRAAAKKPGIVGKRARLALVLRGLGGRRRRR